MKYLKTYEGYKKPKEGDPLIGDYVICDGESHSNIKIENYLKNNIGRIIEDRSSDMATFRTYVVRYKNSPNFFRKEYPYGMITMWDSEIIYHSKNKENVEAFLSAKKYNI